MIQDPNRLLMIIKDRHILIDQLKKAMVLAKADNAGDVFKINRLLMAHQKNCAELEQQLQEITLNHRATEARRIKALERENELAVVRLRIELQQWEINV